MERVIKKIKSFTADEIMLMGEFGFRSKSYYDVENTQIMNFEYFGMMPKLFIEPTEFSWPDLVSEIPKYAKTFGAYQDESLCGFICVVPSSWNRSLKIRTLFVLEKYRGEGIGRMLIEHAMMYGLRKELRSLTLEVENTNGDAIEFYKRQDFKVTGLNLCSDRSYTFFMRKIIQGIEND